jgi:hypothetical protein
VKNVTHGNIEESEEYQAALIDFFNTH